MALAMDRIQIAILLILTALSAADSNTCGIRPLMSEYGSSRIIGGVDAQPGAWPWLVSIQVPSGGGHRQSCGGTLIDKQWVLTAAHCFKTMKKLVAKWQIVLGGYQLSDLSASDAQIRSIDSYVQHENYDPRTERNDVALIKLNESVKFTDYVQPACLPDASADIRALDHCYIGGWGVTKDKTIQTADILQEAIVNQIPLEKCNSSDWYKGNVFGYNLCAGYEEGGIDSCQGDSGGPLMCNNEKSSTYYVIGVTSWGKGCGKSKSPGVYSNTQVFLDWIQSKIKSPQTRSSGVITPASSFSGVITSTPPPTAHRTEDVTTGFVSGTTPSPPPTAIPAEDVTSSADTVTPPTTVIQPLCEPKHQKGEPTNVIQKLKRLYAKMTSTPQGKRKALQKIFGKIGRQIKN